MTAKAILLPQDRFDDPRLHVRPQNVTRSIARWKLGSLLDKECAGLRRDLRTTERRLRRAFRTGRFGRAERVSLEWMATGMRKRSFPTLHSLARLSMFEIARGMRVLGPEAAGWAGWLNWWAENPGRPMPEAKGRTIFTQVRNDVPPCALRRPPGHPGRRDGPNPGTVLLDVDGLLYCVPTILLSPAPARWIGWLSAWRARRRPNLLPLA